ncbi:MAG: hypothetical protein KBS86_02115 [Proteobacteria bacterium]|nr:hypothetical protein [Candidatus Enterousia scatequi]
MKDNNKLSYYDRATRELMERANDYNGMMVGNYTLPYVVAALREAFKQKLTYKKVFSDDDFYRYYPSKQDPAQDFCLISSYYIYARTGADKVWDIRRSGYHWWLQFKGWSEPFDITFTQFVEPHQRAHMTYDYFIKHWEPYTNWGIERRIPTDTDFTEDVARRASILGKYAGLE